MDLSPSSPVVVASPRVAVVGGGLAGMAAAAALAQSGVAVELFEARWTLGGRAGAALQPWEGCRADACQHVAMGCCTNLADFCGRLGIADRFAVHRRLHFIGPDSRCHEMFGVGWLPAPLHLAPALLRLGYLSFGERLHAAQTLVRLGRLRDDEAARGATFAPWLRSQGQSSAAIERFWTPIVVGALSETPEAASLAAARKVFVDGLLAARDAYLLGIPQAPLGDLLDGPAGDALARLGVVVHRAAPVRRIEGAGGRVAALRMADDSVRPVDCAVLAVPCTRAGRLLDESLGAALPHLRDAATIPAAGITAVHLGYDRPLTPLPHAVLVGRLAQWLFRPPYAAQIGRIKGSGVVFSVTDNTCGPPRLLLTEKTTPDPFIRQRDPPAAVHYHQIVLSASHALAPRSADELLNRVTAELAQTFPDAAASRLIHHRVMRHPTAVFAMRPETEALRPAQSTAVANLALAGDWTATGWPGTMEGAVRSGYLAAEAILAAIGRRGQILVADLPRGWLARRLFGESQ